MLKPKNNSCEVHIQPVLTSGTLESTSLPCRINSLRIAPASFAELFRQVPHQVPKSQGGVVIERYRRAVGTCATAAACERFWKIPLPNSRSRNEAGC